MRTEEKAEKNNNPEDIVALLMHATQNNLIKMYQMSEQKEIRNYHIEFKPMYRCVRSFQWGNEGEKALMLTNINSLVANFPDAIKNINITNSLYQVIYKLAKDYPEISQVDAKDWRKDKSGFLKNPFSTYLEALSPSEQTKNNYYFTKLC